ncbi:MAG: hypothetical protein M1814_001801 [Vezdaea aestivalis]|nr:MAG: hypothetical protein M1814_001801 [Vezdaea aestivalis]
MSDITPKRVAIVGSGCSGLGALWALQQTGHEVHLYEAVDRLGGHTNTVDFKHGKLTTPVDTGFIVMNSATYPNFIAFLKHANVTAVPTEMTFGVSRDQGLFEWAGTSLAGVFAQRSNVLSGRMWAMLFDVIRFNQYALDLLRTDATNSNQETMGEYLERECYSDGFRDDYLVPMTAAVWSFKVPSDTCVETVDRYNHHLLDTISTRPMWKTIPGGSKLYIDAIMRTIPKDRVHLSSPVTSVSRSSAGGVEIQLEGKETLKYDHVILATHGDQALNLIRGSATEEEVLILSAFKTNKNYAVLHSDLRLMPRSRDAWSAWNLITESPSKKNVDTSPKVCLTYNMNILQHISVERYGHVLVTLNPVFPPDPELTQGSWPYEHPLYNSAAIRAQEMLGKIQNTRGISYCGAWTKYGFHEDGFSSGVKVAMDHLGANIPFKFVDGTYIRGRKPTLSWKDYAARLFIWYVQTFVAALLWLFGRANIS